MILAVWIPAWTSALNVFRRSLRKISELKPTWSRCWPPIIGSGSSCAKVDSHKSRCLCLCLRVCVPTCLSMDGQVFACLCAYLYSPKYINININLWNSPGKKTGVGSPFSRGSSWSRDWTQVSWIAGGFFTIWATREAQNINWFRFIHDLELAMSFSSCIRETIRSPIFR